MIDRLGALTAASVLCFGAATARAHISLEQGGTHMSRYGDQEIKAGPCGRAGGTRGTNVYTYEPGQTITITVVEYVPHPGYFRIAFDDDGDDGFVEPQSIAVVDGYDRGGCPINAADRCGEADFCNSPTVLLDNLDPHVSAPANTEYTWEVTLPDIECDNCTLQLIQVMQDPIHGPYNPVVGAFPDLEDIYHQCIDIVLQRSAGAATDPTGVPLPAGAIVCDQPGADAGAPSGGVSGASGAAGSGGAGAPDIEAGTGGTPAAAGTSGSGMPTTPASGGAAGSPSGAPPTSVPAAGAGAPIAAPSNSGDGSDGGCRATGQAAQGQGLALMIALHAIARRRRSTPRS